MYICSILILLNDEVYTRVLGENDIAITELATIQL